MKITIDISDDVAEVIYDNEERTLCTLGAGLKVLGLVRDALPLRPQVGDYVKTLSHSGRVVAVHGDRMWIKTANADQIILRSAVFEFTRGAL